MPQSSVRRASRTGDVVVVGSTRIVVVADGATEPPAPPMADDFDATVVRLRSSVVGGTVTIAFTDIVDSTAIGPALGDRRVVRAARTSRPHRRAVLVERFGGSEVKHQGDGFMLTFPSAHQAV